MAVDVATRLLKVGKVPRREQREEIVAIRGEVAPPEDSATIRSGRARARELFGQDCRPVDDDMLVRYRTDHRSLWRYVDLPA